jgi:hypothetical protein
MFHHIRRAANLFVPFVAGGLFFLTGCAPSAPPMGKTGATSTAQSKGSGDHDHNHDDDHGHHHHHHAEKGPHEGTLVAIGQDDAHLEIVLDAKTGTLTAYVLDGAAEKPIAITQKSLQLALTLEHHDHDGDKSDGDKADEADKKGDADKKDEIPDDVVLLMLTAVSSGKDGTASEFSGQLDALKGADEFDASLTSIKIGDKEFMGVKFKFPEGNEHDHHH